MQSRMGKYYDDTSDDKRTRKNHGLYQDIKDTELDDFKINSNVAVLDDDASNIDVSEIRELLNSKYNEIPKRKSIVLDPEESREPIIDETKDYDINTILQKARSEKPVDYEVERLKKLRDTQYNILKNLDLAGKGEEMDMETTKTLTEEEKRLLTLINTITKQELEKKEDLNPLDILTDLKGNEQTKVLEPVSLENPVDTEMIKEVVQEEVQSQIDRSFYTNSSAFTQSDFDDFNDLKEDVKSSKVLIQILIVLILIVLVVGIIILLNTFLNLGWF